MAEAEKKTRNTKKKKQYNHPKSERWLKQARKRETLRGDDKRQEEKGYP